MTESSNFQAVILITYDATSASWEDNVASINGGIIAGLSAKWKSGLIVEDLLDSRSSECVRH